MGYSTIYASVQAQQYNGVIHNEGTVQIQMITDGTSNTFLFGEHCHGNLLTYDTRYGVSDNSWQSGRWYDTLFATLYPLNAKPTLYANASYMGNQNYYYPTIASSTHPGGCNFAFCDGSVRFIKDSIDTWNAACTGGGPESSMVPCGVTFDPSTYVYTNNSARVGVYQALSTRNGDEVISADAY